MIIGKGFRDLPAKILPNQHFTLFLNPQFQAMLHQSYFSYQKMATKARMQWLVSPTMKRSILPFIFEDVWIRAYIFTTGQVIRSKVFKTAKPILGKNDSDYSSSCKKRLLLCKIWTCGPDLIIISVVPFSGRKFLQFQESTPGGDAKT